MKKVMLFLIFGILLVSMLSVGLVVAEGNGVQAGQNDDVVDENEDEIECEDLNQEECEANDECGYYADEESDADWCKKIKDVSLEKRKNRKDKGKNPPYAFGHRFRLQDRNMTRAEFREQIRSKWGNKTEEGEDGEMRVYLSNGRKAHLKIMPNVASEKALKRLRLRNCNESNNCSIELKEVGKGEGNKTRAAYEVQMQRHHKLLGMFRIKATNKVQVDAETGEIIRVKKPWWAFLASEENETEEEEIA